MLHCRQIPSGRTARWPEGQASEAPAVGFLLGSRETSDAEDILVRSCICTPSQPPVNASNQRSSESHGHVRCARICELVDTRKITHMCKLLSQRQHKALTTHTKVNFVLKRYTRRPAASNPRFLSRDDVCLPGPFSRAPRGPSPPD